MTDRPALDIRPGTPETHRQQASTIATALMFPGPDDEGWERSAASWVDVPSFAAWDGDRCVGSVAQFLVDTTVPGGAMLPTGAVSRVGVLPTHRRRGIATALMRRLVDDAAERDLALMSLRASEATIYERYGFGMAGEEATWTVDTARARPLRARGSGTARFVDRAEVFDTVRAVYARCLHRRPGMVTRPDSWWRRYLAEAMKQGTTSYVVVVERDGDAVGYAHYDLAWNEDDPGVGGGRGVAHDVIGVDDAAELALWSYLLDVDLVRSWRCEQRPVDDLLRDAVADRRAVVVTAVDDEQWVRIVSVERALSARRYGPVDGAVLIAVDDPWIDVNNGTWRVSAHGAERTDGEPQLRAGIATLSAAYLGGTAWFTLAAAGRVEVRDPAAVRIADALFASRPLPWCGSFF